MWLEWLGSIGMVPYGEIRVSGDGDGGHEDNGSPHKFKFPLKPLFVNLDKDFGIIPSNILFDTSKYCKVLELIWGIGPVKLFPPKSNIERLVRQLMDGGMEPIKLFE